MSYGSSAACVIALTVAATVVMPSGSAAASTCGATTDDWVGGISTSWDDAGNWTAGHVPTATDDVCVDAPGTTVLAAGNESVASVVALSPVSITGTLTLSAADRSSSLADVTLSGTLTGPGSVTLSGSSVWSAGAMTGSGTTVVATGATLTGTAVWPKYLTLTDRTLRNDGTISLNDETEVLLFAAGFVDNAGRIELGGEAEFGDRFDPAQTGKFLNTGTIVTVGTAAAYPTAYFALPVRNDGTIIAQPGAPLQLRNGDWGDGPSVGVFSGVTFWYGRYTFGPDTILKGANRLNGTVTEVGDTTWADPPVIDGGYLEVDGTLTTTGDVTLVGNGDIDAVGALVVAGTLNWIDGGLNDNISVSPGGQILATSVNQDPQHIDHTFEGVLNNAGTVVVDGANIEFNAPSWEVQTIRNVGTLELRGDVSFGCLDASCPMTLVNTGLVEKTAGAGTAYLQEMDNWGEVRVDSGTLDVEQLAGYSASRQELSQGTYTLSGRLQVPGLAIGTLSTKLTLDGPAAGVADEHGNDSLGSLSRLARGGSLSLRNGSSVSTAAVSSAGSIDVSDSSQLATPSLTLTTGAKLSGTGTIAGDVHDQAGEVSPGSSVQPATLTVAGNYDQGASGKLTVDESAAGGDVLDVTGTAALGGTLALRTDVTNRPVVGSSAALLASAGSSGAFAQITGVDLPSGGGYYWLSRSGGSLSTTVHPVSERPAGSLSINGGGPYTRSTSVTLTIDVPTALTVTGMRVANDAAPTGAWQAPATSLARTLPTKNGVHTVQVQFRDAEGNTSTVAIATITLDTLAPAVTITTPTTPTSAAVVAFSETVSGVTADDVAIRDPAGAIVPATQTCADGTGAAVACTATTVRTVRVLPRSALVGGVAYTVAVNPSTANGRVVDKAGNAASATSISFTL